MSAFVPNLSLPHKQSDGGAAWFSCVKNLSRFSSLVWEDIYKREKRVQSFLSAVTCPLCFTHGRLSSGSWIYAVVLWKVLQNQQVFLWQTWGTVFHQVFQHSFMISLVSRTKRSSLSSRNGLPISSTTADSDVTSFTNVAWTPGTRMMFMVMLLTVFLVWSRGIILEFGDHPCYFRTSHHPTPESWRIVGKTYCTTGSFDDSVFILTTLVNGHGRKCIICFVLNTFSSTEFL